MRLRMLLARLALDPGRPVSADTLIDDLWGEQAPAGAAGALQGLVSRLRKALDGAGTLELAAGGYRLSVRAGEVDAGQFEELAARGRRELAAGRHKEAAGTLAGALGMWQGAALADVREAPFADPVATRLHNLRQAAAEDRIDAELHLGGHADVLADLESLAAGNPLSERLAGLRMRALAAASRQGDALAVYQEIRARLGDELGVDPTPALQGLHLALLRGEMEQPAARAQAVPSRLPAQLTSFVGRESELAQVAALLSAGRLVTIVGPGGAGKTRLSLEAVARDPAYRAGRVWFVSLAGVSVPGQVADAVLGVLNSSRLYEGGQSAPLERVCELLDVGDAVLLLDNCEHLVGAAAELADQLLVRLPHLRILATSREALAITGEALCHLGPLKVPKDAAVAAEAEAVRLFVDRAASVRPGFALDAATVDAVVEICWRLDGMPLALELAAAKLRSMSVDQIAERLDDRFRLLTSGSRAALPRQRTLLAVVEWSWDLLEEQERVLARRLAAFPGGATLAALEAVCADAALPAADIVYVIGSLVEKSIVLETGDRYRMLETIRAYAQDRLAASGDDLAVPYTGYFLALAEEHEPLLRAREQLRAIAVFDAEHDNLALALRMVFDTADAQRAARFVRAMFWYWGLRGMVTQYTAAMAEVLAFGDPLPEEARTAFIVAQSAAPLAAPQRPYLDLDSPAALAFHPALPMLRMAQMAPHENRHEVVRQALESADPWVRASVLWTQDDAHVEEGDLETGEHTRLEALRCFEEVGERWGMVMCLLRISRVHSLRAERALAIATAERAVAISSELGTEMHLLWTKTRLARERMNGGDLDGAFRDIHAAIRQAKEQSHRRIETSMHSSLAIAYRLSGDVEQADRVLDQLDDLAGRLSASERRSSNASLGFRLANRLAEGAAGPARELLGQVVSELFGDRHANGLAWGAELLGWLLSLEGDPVGAATALGMSQVIRGAFDQGDPEMRALVAVLTHRLGTDGHREAFATGAGLPRQEALARLADQAAFLR
ncbi:BTAD domain-containing putative transcriptional regulator [Nonomuraea sp. NPDC002799]